MQPLYIRPPKQQKMKTNIKKQDGTISMQNDADNLMEENIENEFYIQNHDDDGWTDGMIYDKKYFDDTKIFPCDMTNKVTDNCSQQTKQSKQTITSKKTTQESNRKVPTIKPSYDEKHFAERKEILRAAQAYLNCPIELKNVSYSLQPIKRIPPTNKKQKKNKIGSCPMLEVDMIVYGRDEGQDEDICNPHDILIEKEYGDATFKNWGEGGEEIPEVDDQLAATLMLVRMVNRIPLLDGAEAHACGLVRGLASKASMWNSFGLDISNIDSPKIKGTDFSIYSGEKKSCRRKAKQSQETQATELDLHIPLFSVKDSLQLRPYFQSSTHDLFEVGDEANTFNKKTYSTHAENDQFNLKTPLQLRDSKLLPAGLRLRKILVIAHIHAKPLDLPLPTLSKVGFFVALLIAIIVTFIYQYDSYLFF